MENEEQDIFINHDARWKEIIANLFEDFIKFFLPEAHKLIDFGTEVIFLEQELLKLFPNKDKKGKVVNDKLVKVKLKTGEEKWVLIHIEVQSSYESDFDERMFTYFYRIFDKYSQKITAIAIYTGDKVPRKSDTFAYEFLGTKLLYQFNTYKIKDISEEELLTSNNPFALAVLAHKYLIKSKKDYDKRYSFKLKLIRLCKEKKYSDKQIINLFRFINLILILPQSMHAKFEEKIVKDYIKLPKMKRTEAELRFADKVHIALYGETIEETVNKRVAKRVAKEIAKEIAKVEKEVEAKVEKEVKAKVEKEVKAKVEKEVKAKVEKEVKAKVEKEVKAKVEKEVKAKIEKEVKEKIVSQKRKFEEKATAEKKIILTNLIKTADLTDKQISQIVDVPVNVIKKTRKELKNK